MLRRTAGKLYFYLRIWAEKATVKLEFEEVLSYACRLLNNVLKFGS